MNPPPASGSLPTVEPTGYAAEINLENDNDSHVLLIRMIGGGKRVLDVGCWTAETAAFLRKQNVALVGIEHDPEAAKIARGRLDRVIEADVESFDLAASFGDEKFDVIVFGDVLEHLVDPAATLRNFRGLLAPGGQVLASLPNIAHGSIRLRLLKGDFRYSETGILDRTHLRFFTRTTLHELFENSGFAIVETKQTTLDPLVEPTGPVDIAGIDSDVLRQIQEDDEAHIYQFVVRAVPDDAAHAIRALYQRELVATRELSDLRRLARRHRQGDSPLVLLTLVGAPPGHDSEWCASLVARELSRRLPGSSVVVHVASEPSTAHLRWADALLVVGRDDSLGLPSGDVIKLDLGPAALSGVTGGPALPLLGAAIVVARTLKEIDSDARSAMLRLLGIIPQSSFFVVVVDDVDDLDGLALLLERQTVTDVALLGLGSGTAAAELERRLLEGQVVGVHELPKDLPVEDLLTTLSTAEGVITTDLTVALMALALGRPHGMLGDPTIRPVIASLGGSAVDQVPALDAALRRTADLSLVRHALAEVQAAVDDRLDEVANRIHNLARGRTARDEHDSEHVELLEITVAHLQRRLLEERTALAAQFETIEVEQAMQASELRAKAELEATLRKLRQAALTYRIAIVDLQEELHARRAPQSQSQGRLSPRRLRRGLARRLRDR